MFTNNLIEKRDEINRIFEENKGQAFSLFDLIEVNLELEELLHIKVDVVSENGLKDNEI